VDEQLHYLERTLSRIIKHLTGVSTPRPQALSFQHKVESAYHPNPFHTSPDTLLPSIDSIFIEACINYMQENTVLLRNFQEESQTFTANIINSWISEEQNLEYIKEYLKHEIQTCLDCVVLGSHSDAVFQLRGDIGISMYVVVGKTYGYSWHNILMDHIANLCEKESPKSPRRAGRGRRKLLDEETVVVSDPEIIQSMQSINSDSHPYISITINHSVPAKIYSNPTIPICFCGFIEEISQFVGSNQLLKRSFAICSCFLQDQIMFLRSSTGVKIDSVRVNEMDSDIVWILILMVFNRYPTEAIIHPLQCLHILLSEMSRYDPQHHILSIFGLLNAKSFSAPTSARLTMLPTAILDKYMKKFSEANLLLSGTVSDVLEERTRYQQPMVNVSSKRSFLYQHPITQEVRASTVDIIFKTSSNSLADVFQLGVVRYTKFLREIKADAQPGSLIFPFTSKEKYQYLEDFFGPHSTRVFSVPQKPRYSTSSGSGSPRGSVKALQQIHSALAYCNTVYNEVISDNALQFAVIQGLEMKGALPVGEVGKAISIHCDAANLSKYLKEKHGGLKKYLERYPALFVFGNDHEFNPHVFLISKLSTEQKAMINRQTNTISMDQMIQYRQVRL
jgi:hypothetical protein